LHEVPVRATTAKRSAGRRIFMVRGALRRVEGGS